MPSRRPRWIEQTSSRWSSSRSRKGQSRRVTSTIPSLALRKRGSNPAAAIASCSTARLCRAAARAPGFGTPRAARYRPHSRARSVARVRARAPETRPARISARRRKSRLSRSIARPRRTSSAGARPSRPCGPRAGPVRPPRAGAGAGAACSGAGTGASRARGPRPDGPTAGGSGRAGTACRRRAPCGSRAGSAHGRARAAPGDRRDGRASTPASAGRTMGESTVRTVPIRIIRAPPIRTGIRARGPGP